MKVSLLHHWLVSMRGGEKVLEQFCRMMPEADIHTLVKSRKPEALSHSIRTHHISATILDGIPWADMYYQSMLPFFPVAIKNHKVEADFILSSDASMIKGMKKEDGVPHVCYCHSPPRYLWDLQDEYLDSIGDIKALLLKKITPYLQKFDLQSVKNVDHFIANSEFVRKRIQRIYGRDSVVIHPPVELAAFSPAKSSEDYYLIVSALVPYKNVKLAVKAFNKLGKRLVIVGEGSEREKLENLAGKNIDFMGSQPFSVLKAHFESCKAFIFPGIEDFGITPLEAQACGKPVIAYNEGGALETVRDGETGLFFEEQSPESLIEAVQKFESRQHEFSWEACRENAERFSPQRFRHEIKDFLISRYPSYFSDFLWAN